MLQQNEWQKVMEQNLKNDQSKNVDSELQIVIDIASEFPICRDNLQQSFVCDICGLN